MTSQFIGKYEIIATLGRGSMGVVYKAKDPEIGRVVAIKTLRSVFLSDDEAGNEAMQRFRQEARSAGSLYHPNIVTIFEAGRTANGSPYIVMELIEGTSLESFIKDNDGLEVPAVLHYLAQVASAVDYAHSHGIIHRDLKPSNVLVDAQHRPHLLDFGVAKISDTSLTPAGTVVGTPSYMSPEQIRGEDLSLSTDVFSLAVVAFESLTGKRPFPGKDFSTVVSNIIHKEPLSFADVGSALPLELESVLMRALDKDPSQRPASALELIDALARAVGALVDGNGLVGGFNSGMSLKDIMALAPEAEQVPSSKEVGSQQVRLTPNASRGAPDRSPEIADRFQSEEVPGLPELQGPPTEERDKHVVQEELSRAAERKSGLGTGLLVALLLITGGAYVQFGDRLHAYIGSMLSSPSEQDAGKVGAAEPDGRETVDKPFDIAVELLNARGLISRKKLAALNNSRLNGFLTFMATRTTAQDVEISLVLVQEAAKRANLDLIEGLKAISAHPRTKVRVEVLKVFRDLRYHSQYAGYEVVAERLYDKDFIVRGWAAKVLGLIRTEASRKSLLGRQHVEQHKVVKRVINSSLKRLGDAPLPGESMATNSNQNDAG
jgi:serine/threonine protein kinase